MFLFQMHESQTPSSNAKVDLGKYHGHSLSYTGGPNIFLPLGIGGFGIKSTTTGEVNLRGTTELSMAKVKELQQLVGPDAPVYLRISLHRGGSYSYPNEYKQNYSKVKMEGGEGWEKKEDDRFIANKSGRKDITFSGQAVTPGGVGLKEIKLKFDFQPGLRTDFQAGVPTQYMESFSLDDREQQMEFSGDPQDLRIKVIGVAVSPVHTVYFGSEEKFDLYRKSISKAMKKFGKNITPDVAREKEWKITYRNGFREETLPEAKFLGVSDNGSLIFSSKYAYIPLASPPGTTLIHLREPVAIEIDPRNISSIRR